MKVITPTKFRQTLFENLERVLRGEEVVIRTQKGNVVMLSEAMWGRGKRKAQKDPLKPKIEGAVCGDLEQADDELRQYLQWPR